MGEGKLTPAMLHGLSVLASLRHEATAGALQRDGVNSTALWALERRERVTWTRYANGIHFAITDAGRAALNQEDSNAG